MTKTWIYLVKVRERRLGFFQNSIQNTENRMNNSWRVLAAILRFSFKYKMVVGWWLLNKSVGTEPGFTLFHLSTQTLNIHSAQQLFFLVLYGTTPWAAPENSCSERERPNLLRPGPLLADCSTFFREGDNFSFFLGGSELRTRSSFRSSSVIMNTDHN